MSKSPARRIVIFGATGRVGRLLARTFHKAGYDIVTVGRRGSVLEQMPGEPQVLDLSASGAGPDFIRPGDIVINVVHARFTKKIAELCPSDISRYVVIGSTRYLTRFPDKKAAEVIAAAKFLGTSNLPWVMLHPTMIYGAQGENNVQRMAALIRRFHLVPLPNGGRALIQPVHVSDVVSCIVSAATRPGIEGKTIHLGGPQAVPYADFLRAIAQANETWVRVVSMPPVLLRLVAGLTALVPGIPTISGAEVQRLLEDKDVDISAMKQLLDVTPRSLEQGLSETFRT